MGSLTESYLESFLKDLQFKNKEEELYNKPLRIAYAGKGFQSMFWEALKRKYSPITDIELDRAMRNIICNYKGLTLWQEVIKESIKCTSWSKNNGKSLRIFLFENYSFYSTETRNKIVDIYEGTLIPK